MGKDDRLRRLCGFLGGTLALLILLVSCGERVTHLARLPTDAVVLAFGDSITYGTGASQDESYPAQLSRLIHRTVINAGVPGERSEQGASRLPQLLDQHRPRLLLLCHGGNDILQRGDLVQAAQHLRSMVKSAREQGIDVVLIAVPQWSLGLSPALFYREVAREFGLPLEQEALQEILTDRDLKFDTVHPNAAGYRELAQAVATLLRRTGAIE